MSLARAAVRGAGATFTGQWGRLVVQLGSTMVLARLLTPEDYGLVGMVLAITAFADRLKSMGLSTVTIQRRSIDQQQLSFLFWVNVGLGLVVAALLAALAPVVARFFGEPELTGITIGLSTAFVFGGVAAQHLALLSRRLQFGSLATIEISAMVFGALISIAAAWFGAGYWALVLFHAVQPLVRLCMAWWRTRWVPSRPGRARDGRAMLAFGANLSGFELLNYFSRNMDNVLIGRFLGAGPLGIYSKAYSLLLLPLQQIQGPIQRVAIPTLSRLQDTPERFRRFFVTGVRSVAFVVMPLIALLIVAADELVLIMLGSQWTEAVPIFRILAVAGMAQALSHSNGWLYVCLGRARRQFAWAAISAPLVVTAFAVGLQWGLTGVATAYAIAVWTLLLPSFWNATTGTPVTIADILRCGVRPAVISAAGSLAGVGMRWLLPDVPLLVGAVAIGVSFLLSAGGVVMLWPSARADVGELVGLVRGSFGTSEDEKVG